MSDPTNPPPADNRTRDQTPEEVQRMLSPPTAPARPQSLFAAGDPVPGLASWVLERRLGGGGFGEVWLARHDWKKEERPRAVKFCTHPAAKHRLITYEKKVVVRVMKHAGEHPHIVPLLECNLDGATPWLMYEYVEGGTLADAILDLERRPTAERLAYTVQALHAIAAALGHCHRLDPAIVHRDLKPQNVLMDGRSPRITDFGIGGVALATVDAPDTPSDMSAEFPTILHKTGTVRYAPPEQLFGSLPNPRDDVYALGVIAYQMLTGNLRFAPGTDAADVLSELEVPADLVSLVVKSVAMDPARRPKDAREWEARLGGWGKAKALVVLYIQTVRVAVSGTWYSRPLSAPTAEWVEAATTPAEVAVEAAREYRLAVASDGAMDTLRSLEHLTVLRALDLSFTRVTDASLAHLNGFVLLRQLDLAECDRLTDAGLAHLRGLTALQQLNLGETRITDAGLAYLKDLPALQHLDLSFCSGLTDAGLSHLGNLANLRSLNLGGCSGITGVGLVHLTSLSSLQSLNLPGCTRLTDAGLAHLPGLAQLQALNLRGCVGLTDEGLAHLKTLPAIQSLSLSGCEQITDKGLAHLKELTSLQQLYLSGCVRVRDASVAALKEALPNCKLQN